ncbi:hypothetical protein C8R44DRAFT_895630 [Mycena epipterygia]|nr:hypothetical protein C8R44DRAFT_895630 [Mycena epipterygia]
MADEPCFPEEALPSQAIPIITASDSPSSTCAFITNSRNFTIAGAQFTNVVNCVATVPSDFRTIPLGDLDLRNEIRLEESGLSDMTAAVYQGENAEQTWKHEIAKYSGLRHPNIVQLYGTVSSGGLYAAIFHDDLVPVEQFMDEYRHSVISTVYLYGYFGTELEDAQEYYRSLFWSSHSPIPYLGYDGQPVESALKFRPTGRSTPSRIFGRLARHIPVYP